MRRLQSRQIRTIVVDDENRIRRGIERLVKLGGDEFEIVGSFSSGIELMNYVQKESFEFDLLITDIKMPGIDGLTLIKEMKKWISFEAVVISGFNDFQYLQTAIREGAIDYMVKPLIREEFRSQLGKVKEKIQHKWEEEEKLEEMDSQLNYVKQTQKLSDLTKGHEIDLSEMEWTRDFPKGKYFLLYISKDHVATKKQSISFDNQRMAVDKVINDVLENFYKGTKTYYWCWKGEKSSFWILIQTEKEEERPETLLAEKLQSKIKAGTQLSNTIAISRMFSDVALLPNMRDDLLSLIQFRLIYGGNQIYSFSSMEKGIIDKRNIKELDIIINRILQSLDRFQIEESFDLLNQFLIDLEKLVSPQEIERNIQSLAIQIVNQLIKKSSTKNEMTLIQEALQLTKKSPNFVVLKNNVKDWMKKVVKILEKMNEKELVDPILEAKKWIVNNLGKNITIEKIAKEIYMNPTYFCEYFKNQTGRTVLDYVTKVRIDKAKELLLSSDLKIYDISQQVGYSDTKYFSKLFKKYFGEVPSRYKEKTKFYDQ